MNKHLHRIVFNAARGERMVVQETARSAGKATGATACTAALALATLLAALPAAAQIVPNPMVPGAFRPQVLAAPNGVPLVNITTPSAAGVSRNIYNQFDVLNNGVVLNNSRTPVQTQLGGWVQGNPWLAGGGARVILNEITSGHPTQLRGYIEVGGQRAEVVVANPAGIQVDGGGFINASRATLTTGAPQLDALGGLESFLVRGGTVTIDGAGLDASRTDYAAILARAVQVNAGIWANEIGAGQATVAPAAGAGAAPSFALDVAALGGMYANKITLVGTEAGLGVRNAGGIGAGAGGLIVTAAGRLENTGTLEGQRVELASVSIIDNRGGTIRQGGSAALGLAAPALSNTGGVIGAEPPATGGSAPGGAESPGAGAGGTGGATTPGDGGPAAGGPGRTESAGAAAPVPAAPGSIAAGVAILNDGGRIHAGGDIALNTPRIDNTGGSLAVARMDVSGPAFSNAGGTLDVSDSFRANVESLDNSGGTLRAGSLDIATSGDLHNVDGTLASHGEATVSVGGQLDNTRGTLAAAGGLGAAVSGAVNNAAGTIAANQALHLSAAALDNTQGAIQSAADAARLNLAGHLDNSQGTLAAGTDLGVQAGSLANSGTLRGNNDTHVAAAGALTSDGSITAGRHATLVADSVVVGATGVLGAGILADGSLAGAGDLAVTATQGLAAHGTNLAAGSARLQGASVDLSSSRTGGARIDIAASHGDVATGNATIATPGTLAITADGSAAQTLANQGGTLSAGQLALQASNIANTGGGEIVQTGAGTTTIAASGSLDNSGGRIAANGLHLTLQAATLANTGGRIEHAGTGTLTIAGGSFSGADGQITGNGALNIDLSGAFDQAGGSIHAEQVSVQAASLGNQGGRIVQGGSGSTVLTISGAADNRGGTIASNGEVRASFGALKNQSGSLQAAGDAGLDLAVPTHLDNTAGGQILAGGHTTVQAGTLANDGGRITAGDDLEIAATGAASNQGGMLAANGNTTLAAASLDNTGGTAAAVHGGLSVRTAGATTNAGGTLQAGGATLLSNGGLDNSGGKVFGDSVSVDTHGQQLVNALGTLAATNAVTLNTGALLNDAGLVQSGGPLAIDTHGQALSNTNAAGHASAGSAGQGGITSGDALTLSAGAVHNAGGFIGAAGQLTASTQAFSNTAGGQVLSQAGASIDANGAAYDNRGGQTQAQGDLAMTAGHVDNAGGLLRASATATLNADTVSNAGTLGAEQGIEGGNVAITATGLDNTAGVIRANENVTVTVRGTVDNTGGLVSAGGTLTLTDPNAADPTAKTLGVVNTGGTLVADQGAAIDAAGFSGDGTLVSGRDLSVALTQDITNNAEVMANGNLRYGTTGQLINNGTLLAGQALAIGGAVVNNTAGGEMSGQNTTVNAGVLNNRGLIDSAGTTRIDAGVVDNVGTGRIYGDAVAIGAGQVNNDAETVDGVASAGTIAGRFNLDIGANEINNRAHAMIFSGGDMAIGGVLDAQGKASGAGGVLNNLSASIESLGHLSIHVGQVDNRDVHIRLGPQQTTVEGPTPLIAVTGAGFFTPDEVVMVPGTPYLFHRNADGSTGALITADGYGIWNVTSTTTADTAVDADPARIVSGGDMTLVGAMHNTGSRIVAGGTLSAANMHNSEALSGSSKTDVFATVVNHKGEFQPPVIMPGAPVTLQLGAFEYTQGADATTGYALGSATVGAAGTHGGGAAGAHGGVHPGTIVEVAAAVGKVASTPGAGADAASGPSGADGAGASQSLPMVVRTSAPDIGIPQASLFRTNAGAPGYLVETDPRFAGYRQWLGSEYLLDRLGLDPNNLHKRLGDGFYEQKLIREQVAQLTGYRYLEGFTNDEAQYTALMNAGATFAQAYGLRVGVALTPAQMAQLTSDIVWLVERDVSLADGSVQRVLVPQVYVRVRPGDIDGSGALLAGNKVDIQSGDASLVNTGTIAGRQLVSISAGTIDNLGGRISGGEVDLKAKIDINNVGGTIDARDRLNLEAGRSIDVRTTVGEGALGNTRIDRVAGLYVSNPTGTMTVKAGNDIHLVGAKIVNEGSGATRVEAGNNLTLGTVTQSRTAVAIGEGAVGVAMSSQESGTRIRTGGALTLQAGNDLVARQADIDSGGPVSLKAGRDIRLEAGVARESVNTAYNDAGSSGQTSYSRSRSIGTQIRSGDAISIEARRDFASRAAIVEARGDLSVTAERDVLIGAGWDSTQVSISKHDTKKGALHSTTTSFDAQASSDMATQTRFSGNNVSLEARTGDLNLIGADVAARGDATLKAGDNVNIVSAEQSASASASRDEKSSGLLFRGGAASTRALKGDSASLASTVQRASTVTAAGNLSVTAGESANVYASHLAAQGDLSITGKEVNVYSGVDASSAGMGSRESSDGVTALLHRPGMGFDNRRSEDNRIGSTTLAEASLSGRNVTLTASERDITLGAARIQAHNDVTLNAEQGAVNFNVVNTGQEISQSAGGSDIMYQRTSDSGAVSEQANYTRIEAGGQLNLNTDQVNVQVGQTALRVGEGQQSALMPVQSIESVLSQQSGQAGMSWLSQVQQQADLGNLELNWQGVPLEYRQWAESQSGLTPEGAAIVTIVASVMSYGTASGWGAAAGEAAAGATGSAGFGTFVQGAVTAGITTLASQAAVSLINNNGDLGKVLKDLGSSRSIKSLVSAVLTGGVLQGLDLNPTGLAMPGAGTKEVFDLLATNLKAAGAGALIDTALYGGSLGDRLEDALKSALINTAAAKGANFIGDLTLAGKLNDFTNKAAHAIAGCAAGAASAGNSSGCAPGALGAAIGELAAEIYGRHGNTVQVAGLVSALAVAMAGGDANAIMLAQQAGGNAAANNYVSHSPFAGVRGIVARENARLMAACGLNCTEDDFRRIDQQVAKVERVANLAAVAQTSSMTTAQAQELVQFLVELAPVYGTGESLLQLITGNSTITGQEASRFWASVGMVPVAGGVLRRVGASTANAVTAAVQRMASNGGISSLDWSRISARTGGDAAEHVTINHGAISLTKPNQGVFYGDPISSIENAWLVAHQNGIKPVTIGNRDVYVVPHPNSGYAGGMGGQLQNYDHITIITEAGTSRVVTGYPSGGTPPLPIGYDFFQ